MNLSVQVMSKPTYKLKPVDQLTPKVGLYFSLMEELRKNLLEKIADLTDEQLDFSPDESVVETVGTLLHHISGIEWSWIFEDIDGKEMDFEEWKYAFPLRDGVKLPQQKGMGK